MNQNLQQAYKEGDDAYYCGKNEEANPYQVGTDQFKAWLQGFKKLPLNVK